ncbi:MAG: hypothetical protein WCG47_24585 [Dermatophilaceae bacterium]
MTAEVTQVLDMLAGPQAVPRVLAGVAIDTFAPSLVGVGRDGGPRTPCYTYADSRCAAQVGVLRGELAEGAVQQRTGRRLHSSYLAPAAVGA